MKKFYKIITLLSITCALGFCACGVEKPVEKDEQIIEQEESTKVEEIRGDKISDYIESTESRAILDYVSDDKQTVGMYMTFHVKNKTTDKVVSDFIGTISLYSEDGTLIATEDTSIGTLAPGEIGIVGEYFELTRDELQTNPIAKLGTKTANYYDVKSISGFKQSDLEFSNFSTKSDSEMNTEVLLNVKNNTNKTVSQDITISIICKKDGKYAGFVTSPSSITNIQPGDNPVHLDGSHIIPSDCDEYEVFVDYMDWDK